MELNPNLNTRGEDIPIWEYSQEGGRTRPINKEILYKNLCDFANVFEAFGIKYWLSHGTMLGVYRDGDFISIDDDIDLGAPMSDREKGIKAEIALRDLGFYVPPTGDPRKPVDPKSNMPYSDTVAIRGGEKIEVWWFADKDDKYVYDIYRTEELHHDKKYYDKLSSIDFKGRTFPIPNHIEDWLVMMYDNWKVPQDRKYNRS